MTRRRTGRALLLAAGTLAAAAAAGPGVAAAGPGSGPDAGGSGPAAGLAAAASPTTPPTAGSPSAEDDADPVQVVLTGLTPLDPADATATTVTVDGTIRNVSDDPVTALSVYLRMSRLPFPDRASLDQVLDPAYRPGLRRANFVLSDVELLPGASTTFRLEVPVDDLDLVDPGVYPFGIEVLGAPASGIRGELGRTMTALPWLPDDATAGLEPTRVAVAWPVTAPVDLAGDGSYLSDDLGASMAPGGRLAEVLAAPAGAGLTWLVDPALLEAAADLADGYTVRAAPEAEAVEGEHADDADDWLDRLGELASAGAVRLAPYADVDATALQRHGLGGLVGRAVVVAPEVAVAAGVDALDRSVSLVRPAGGVLDQPTLDLLEGAGVHTVLLDRDAVTVTGGETAGGNGSGYAALVELPGGTTALLTDALLGDLLAAAEADATSIQSRQLLLAHTAVAALDRLGDDGGEGDGDGGSTTESVDPAVMVVAADEASHGTPGAVTDALADDVAWIEPSTLDALASTGATGTAELRDLAPAIPPELGAPYLGQVVALRDDDRLRTALVGGDPAGADEVAETERALLRLTAAAWRDAPDEAARLVDRLRAEVAADVGRVRILPANGITLSSQTGRFPLTIQNDLDQPVSVDLDLVSRTPARLRVTTIDAIEVPAGARTTVDVEAAANANGEYLVDARLATSAGQPFGAVTTLEIDATDYDTVAWIAMGVAGTLLLLGSGRRLVRRAKASRAEGHGPRAPA